MDISFESFCNRYYPDAMKAAEITVAKVKDKLNSGYDYRLAMDIGVSFSLEQAYNEYDPEKKATLRTYLSKIVHNSVISELKKQKRLIDKEGASIEPMVGSLMGPYVSEFKNTGDILKGKEGVIGQMLDLIEQLSPVDRTIMKCFLKDSSNYAELALGQLGWSEDKKGAVYVRFNRAKKHLAMLMGGEKPDYRDMYINPAKEG